MAIMEGKCDCGFREELVDPAFGMYHCPKCGEMIMLFPKEEKLEASGFVGKPVKDGAVITKDKRYALKQLCGKCHKPVVHCDRKYLLCLDCLIEMLATEGVIPVSKFLKPKPLNPDDIDYLGVGGIKQ